MDKKMCNQCKLLKDINMFGKFTKKLKSGNVISPKNKCKECETETQRKRRNKEKESDPEKYHKKWADYYAKTKEQNKLAKQKYLSIPENKEKRNAYVRKYKAQRKLNDPSFKLYENLRKKIWKSLKNKSNSSKELLGCEIDHYFKWIEFTMSNDMTWENYGEYWNIDHVKPVDTFDITNPEEAKKAFNWKNTWAMKASANFSKKNNLIETDITKHNEILIKFLKENNSLIESTISIQTTS
jgi:hypothetical protein